MPLVPIAPPIAVPKAGGFDYVTVDAVHRRVYAAQPAASVLLVADADTGKVLRQITVGPMAGVAYTADGTRVYTGNGDAKSVSEVDPQAGNVLRTVSVDGPVDAIAFDESMHRIYADEDDGTRIFVIDTKTMKQIGTVALPGHKPEYLAVDPQTHDVYQNIADESEIAVVDPNTLKVARTIPTPDLKSNHPLQYDASTHTIYAGGANGVLAGYAPDGTKRFSTAMPAHIDQCDLDSSKQQLACAGASGITVFQLSGDQAPKQIGSFPTTADKVHTLAFDDKTNDVWAVMVDRKSMAGSLRGFALH